MVFTQRFTGNFCLPLGPEGTFLRHFREVITQTLISTAHSFQKFLLRTVEIELWTELLRRMVSVFTSALGRLLMTEEQFVFLDSGCMTGRRWALRQMARAAVLVCILLLRLKQLHCQQILCFPSRMATPLTRLKHRNRWK